MSPQPLRFAVLPTLFVALSFSPASLSGTVVAEAAGRRAAAAPPRKAKDELHSFAVVKTPAKPGNEGLRIKVRSKNYDLRWSKSTPVFVHRTEKLSALREATTLHILARKQAEQPGSAGGNYPPTLIQVQVIVAAPNFTPPPIPPKLLNSGLEWVTGKLSKRAKNRELYLEKHQILASLDRKVLVIEKGDPNKFKKKQRLFVDGKIETVDRKKKLLHATRIIAVAPDLPVKEYPVAFDFQAFARQHQKKKKKKDDLDF